MITRKRGRTANSIKDESLEVEVIDVVENVEDIPKPYEGDPADDLDSAGGALDDLFEDLTWTLGRDTSSPLFDIDLADLGVYGARDQDSSLEVSTASSPERMSSDSRMKKRQNLSSSVINKNAIAARMNRLKKKEYVNSLEKRVDIVSTENVELRKENTQLSKRVEELEDETRAPTQMTTTMRCPGSV